VPLAEAAAAVRTPCLQFGKVRAGRFSCDFRFPLSYVQAFGIMLAAFYWTVDVPDDEDDEDGADDGDLGPLAQARRGQST